jgi:thiol:disulfide interchange protein DsbC
MIRAFSTTFTATLVAAGTLFLAATPIAADVADAVAADDKLESVRKKLSGMFEQIEPENINPSPIEGWYAVQKGSTIAYVSGDGRYLLQGDLIDLDTEVNLSETSRNSARRDLLASLDQDQLITFSPAEVKHTITVFTDVECTYCRRLHSQIDEYLAHGIEVRYMLYPRYGPASQSWNTSEEVWCATDRNKALTAAKLDRKFESSACDASIVQDHYVLGQQVGLSGTPAILLADGTLISGYLPPDTLYDRLENQPVVD